jgi:hypothetical protein
MNQALAVTLHLGDCLNVLRTLPDASVDAVVTDPPAGISFMGKEWDHHKGGRAHWVAWMVFRMAEARRVIRPGGYALVWALPRTSHWTALAMEEAGWTIRDRISHLFGTGFPKSKSCLKPGAEDWWLCKAPGPLLPLEIEAGRIPANGDKLGGGMLNGTSKVSEGWDRPWRTDPDAIERNKLIHAARVAAAEASGRWPANVCLSCECEDIAPGEGHLPGCPVREIGEQSGERVASKPGQVVRRREPCQYESESIGGESRPAGSVMLAYGDTGTAARFYYQSKASRADRNEGCEGMEAKAVDRYGECGQGPTPQQTPRVTRLEGNGHPTVKATALMQWLCRLVTPAGGTVLDPFMGSGSTGKACVREGFNFVGIEGEAEYLEIARRRIEHERSKMPLLDAANV